MLKRAITNASLQWLVPLVVALCALFFSGWNNANRQTDELTQRVSALEAHQTDDSVKLDHVQTQVDKLVEWALGHK